MVSGTINQFDHFFLILVQFCLPLLAIESLIQHVPVYLQLVIETKLWSYLYHLVVNSSEPTGLLNVYPREALWGIYMTKVCILCCVIDCHYLGLISVSIWVKASVLLIIFHGHVYFLLLVCIHLVCSHLLVTCFL